jgi:hypothetical protein
MRDSKQFHAGGGGGNQLPNTVFLKANKLTMCIMQMVQKQIQEQLKKIGGGG